MSEPLDQFIRKVSDSGLVSSEELVMFCASHSQEQRVQTPEDLQRQLLENGLLTDYQVEALEANDARPLVIGDYIILEKIGQGGMGIVYKARHRRMKRVVAVKMLPTTVDNRDHVLRRFEREVEVAAKLNHPNIVTALDSREQDGQHVLIMEYVEGEPLSDIVERDGPMTVKQAVRCVSQVAAGCEHVHDLGVVHRDLKPANILLDKNGTVKILDVGIAWVDSADDEESLAERTQLTNEGVLMGTPDYMSPEQAVDSHNVDHRTDIYSLGCTLYFLITGRPVFSGRTPIQTLVAHRESALPSLRDRRPDVPDILDAIYLRMIAKRVEDRYQSMSELLVDLRSENVTSDQALNAASNITAETPVDGESPILSEIVDEPTDQYLATRVNGSRAHGTRANSERDPRRYSSYIVRRLVLESLTRLAGVVLGLISGFELGNRLVGPATAIGVLTFSFVGWRSGGGYSWMIARHCGWIPAQPEDKFSEWFRVDKLKWHGVAFVVGGVIGMTGGSFFLGGIFGYTLLMFTDWLRRRRLLEVR
jgi:serine/threonine protein kinase